MQKKGFISYPSSEALNPFIRILNKHLQEYGWEERFDNVWRKPFHLFKLRKEIRILHFHWPETFWRSERPIISFVKAIAFILYIRYAQLIGIHTSFSIHNVLPHYKPGNIALEKYMRRWIIKNFSLTIGHAYNTKNEIKEQLYLSPSHYIEAVHGTYEGHYGVIGNQDEARNILDIPLDKTVLLLSYSNHPYKGTLSFIKKWCETSSNLFLLVLGNVPLPIIEQVNSCSQAKFLTENSNGISGFISDKTLAQAFNACDYLVLPYRDITTSGSYFLALTFLKPVIAPDLDFFKQHTTKDTALLYDHKKRDLSEVFSLIENNWEANYVQMKALKKEYSWSSSAKKIAEEYDKLIV